MDNEGQVLLEMLAPIEDGGFNEVDVTWQVTDVCRPLLSVSKVCDKGQHIVTLDAERAVTSAGGCNAQRRMRAHG